MEYPVTGIINDIDSKKYLMSDDYWVYWNRVQNPGWATRAGGVTAPPAVWWQQRDRWRDTWSRLSDGDEGTGMPWMPRRPPRPKKNTKMGGGMFGSGKNEWWSWLEGREKKGKGKGKGGGDEAGRNDPAGGGKGKGKGKGKCKLFPDLDRGEENAPGCFCPGPRCVYKDQGFFGGASPEQLAWENKTLMRRQTLPGLSDAISSNPDALRKASVRLERTQDGSGKEAATLDPRPPRPVDNPRMPGLSDERQPRIKPYDGGGSLLGAAGKLAADTAMDPLVGANMMEMRAFKRLTATQPEWLSNLRKFKKAKQLHDAGEEKAANKLMGDKDEEAIVEKRAKKRGLKGLMEDPPERQWKPPPPQNYKDLYEMKYRKFWPAMEVLARRSGSGPARMIEELGQEWRSARVAPERHSNAIQNISESAGADIRAARVALGGPDGREEESIDAVDLELPVTQPTIRQARPLDRNDFPTAVPAANAKAYLGTALGTPPTIPPAALKINRLEKALEDDAQAQKALRPQINSLEQQLSEFAKEPKGTQAQRRDKVKDELEEVESQRKDLMDHGDEIMDELKVAKAVGGERFVEMHPAGSNGAGVEAKVLVDSVRPLYPEFNNSPPSETTYSGIGSVGATGGAALLSMSWNEVQGARLAHRRSSCRSGCRRPEACGAVFL